MDSGVALNPITDWKNTKRIDGSSQDDNKMVRLITNRAKIDPKRIVLRKQIIGCFKAAQIVWEEGIGFPILLGNKLF
jgi:malate dehydrogenase (oxaloacetate-decarboxylating)(NADP+)